MKTKSLALTGLTILLASTLVGCSSGNSTSSKSSDDTKTVAVKKKATTYFKNNKLVTKDYNITITQTKVIQPGETGNEYGEKPVLAFWFKVHNKKAKDLDPNTSWISIFKAVQDNNKDSVNELNVGSLPDEKFIDSQSEKIKVGGTVEMAVSYELDDTTTPVKLTAENMVTGKKLGSMTFKLN
ncbi:DUF5067 domain-containing protein [Companilactobacillus sp. FL22-1]|uniref:DUF5067 domain-containing protein n=1 Tax=Companilactobacillus sp. FL22-1 TaxID=3373892 RepID=UPI00375478EA